MTMNLVYSCFKGTLNPSRRTGIKRYFNVTKKYYTEEDQDTGDLLLLRHRPDTKEWEQEGDAAEV